MKSIFALLLILYSFTAAAAVGSKAGVGRSTTYSADRSLLPGNPSNTIMDVQRGGPGLDRSNPGYLENDYNSPCPVGECDTSGNNYVRPHGRDND